ncbi:MAG: hypothetical protein RML36_09200 [Anaerolineae bacterium]|nr:hypothetical protein [Anaerolineae bacterium]MDW8099642.1 hypothetical protein [Anaerolineae bacterium]
MVLTAEELLAGSELRHEVPIPAELLYPNGYDPAATAEPTTVVLRPLTVRDLQLIVKAARQDDLLTSALMVQRALVQPELNQAQVAAMPAGLLRYLADQVNRISGIGVTADSLERMVQAPLARACFILAREFGWTPQQVSEMTLGQILLYLEMLGDGQASPRTP